MPPDKKKPPARDRRLSGDVSPGGFDTRRDKPPSPKKQAARDLVPIGSVAAEIVADLRFRRQVKHLYRLGPRAVAELLAEISAERGITTIVDQKLATYAELDPTALEAVDDFWPAPLHEVRRTP